MTTNDELDIVRGYLSTAKMKMMAVIQNRLKEGSLASDYAWNVIQDISDAQKSLICLKELEE